MKKSKRLVTAELQKNKKCHILTIFPVLGKMTHMTEIWIWSEYWTSTEHSLKIVTCMITTFLPTFQRWNADGAIYCHNRDYTVGILYFHAGFVNSACKSAPKSGTLSRCPNLPGPDLLGPNFYLGHTRGQSGIRIPIEVQVLVVAACIYLIKGVPYFTHIDWTYNVGLMTYRVAGLGRLSAGANMAMKPFVKRVIIIFATNASFLRVISNFRI